VSRPPLTFQSLHSPNPSQLVGGTGQRLRISAGDSSSPALLSTASCIALFVVLTLCAVRIKLIGELYVLEPVLAGIAIFHVLRGKRFQLHRPLGILVSLLALWLCGQILTDIYRESAFVDYSRGWAKIAFTALNLLALYLITRVDPKRIRIAYLGLIVGQIAGNYAMPNIYAHVYPWKFGLAYPLTTLAALVATTPRIWRHRFGPCLILGSMSALNLVLGARSLAGICFVSSLFTVIASRREITIFAIRMRAAAIPLLGGLAAVIGSHIYGSLAESGSLGMAAQVKYQIQSEGRYGFLLGGRGEIAFSASAIRQSPIVGHGSFTRFSGDLRSAGLGRLEQWGYEYEPASGDRPDLLPTHSGLLGTWVEAGILAVPFWLACLTLLWRGCMRAIQHGQALTPLQVFVSLLSIWDVLFSPFAAERRITLPLAILLLIAQDQNGATSNRGSVTPMRGTHTNTAARELSRVQ
jgi:O-antigen ligase